MDYNTLYYNICNHYKQNPIIDDVYCEPHHIKPRCLGGSNKIDNLVKVPYKAHKLLHRLLVKIHPNNEKLITCYRMMSGNISDESRKVLREKMINQNPCITSGGPWNKGKSIKTRKTPISNKERENLSERMRTNNPNKQGGSRKRKIVVEYMGVCLEFESIKDAMNYMRTETNKTINEASVHNHLKNGKPYKGGIWKYKL